MPYSPSYGQPEFLQDIDGAPIDSPPLVTQKAFSTRFPKMGFQLNGVENVSTPVSSNNDISNFTHNRRTHGEYVQLNGLVFFVNTKGQIGVINPDLDRMWLLEKARNYFSWRGSVPCNGQIQTEYNYAQGDLAAFESGSSHVTYTRKCVYDDDQYKNYRPYAQAQCSGGSLLRPMADEQTGIIGFQTSENTCVIFEGIGNAMGTNVVVKYRGEFDGRRFPVEFNWRDWAFDADPKIPNMNGGGVTRGEAFIPELYNGHIKWAMPKEQAVVMAAYDADGNEIVDEHGRPVVNPERLPSPIPQLHKIPTWLIWRHWFYPHPMSIVKHGLAKYPYVHPGYVAKDYILIRSYVLKPCSASELCAQSCVDIPHENALFKGVAVSDSVKNKAIVTESDLIEITLNCLHEEVPQGSKKKKEAPPCVDNNELPQPEKPCEIDIQRYVATVVGETYYDFDPVVPFLEQIQGFVVNNVDSSPFSTKVVEGIKIVTKQPLFLSAKESRRVGRGVLPEPLPFDWSLAEEMGYDKNTPLAVSWYVNAARDHADRLLWWQRYIPTFFIYQSKPLSAFVVGVTTPHNVGGNYPKYDMWKVDYAGDGNDRSFQFRKINETNSNINDYVPPWLSFSEYRKIPTVVPGIYLPQDPYTFEITLTPGSAPVIAKLNMRQGSGEFTQTPDIKPLLEQYTETYKDFLTQWTTAVLCHEQGDERFGGTALRLHASQYKAFAITAEQILAEHDSLEMPKDYIAEVALALKQQVSATVTAVINQAMDQTLSLHMQVRDGVLNPQEYQNALYMRVFGLLEEALSSFTTPVQDYVNVALNHVIHGFYNRFNQNVRNVARDAFLEFPALFAPYWTNSPFADLEIDNETESLTFTDRFRQRLLEETNTTAATFVSEHNRLYPHNPTSVFVVLSLVRQWFDNVFVPAVEWYTTEPQPQIVKAVAETYLSNYAFIPRHITQVDLPLLPPSFTLPSVHAFMYVSNLSEYAAFMHSLMGKVMTDYLHDYLTYCIKECILFNVVQTHNETTFATERERMLGVDIEDDTTTAIQRCLDYVNAILADVFRPYANAVNQI